MFRDRSVGLVTNHTGVNRRLVSNVELLLKAGYRLKAIFSPEHGLFGYQPDGASVSGHTDPRSGVPVYSLYGNVQAPIAEMLDGLDVVVFDIQDIGARYYTYLSTMILTMEACARLSLPFAVLDRPNPVGGEAVEGNVPDEEWFSFVGAYSLPQRHGMTLGEVALMVAAERGWPRPSVVRMEGWKREMYFPDTGLLWVPPSPNASSFDMAMVYPGTCLLEGTNVSEGRGTTWPFQYVGAPWVDPWRLSSRLNAMELPGVLFRPVYFRPAFGKWAQELVAGVAIHVADVSRVRPVALGVRLLFALRQLFPENFAFRPPSPGGKHFLDLLAGGPDLRLALEAGEPPEAVLTSWQKQSRAFEDRRRSYLLYP